MLNDINYKIAILTLATSKSRDNWISIKDLSLIHISEPTRPY